MLKSKINLLISLRAFNLFISKTFLTLSHKIFASKTFASSNNFDIIFYIYLPQLFGKQIICHIAILRPHIIQLK